MALSKPFFISHLKTFKPHHHPNSSLLSLRFLSFASPEEAAAERRRRKRQLRIEPPLNSLRHAPPRHHHRPPPTNPNTPKLPDSVSALSANRLTLHNRILTLIRQNDLDEASLLVRHSIYSNCRPTVFTCNSVLSALLRMSRYSDLLSLHRFITQAGVVPNVVTHNLLITAYCDCRKMDTALEHYKQLLNDAPFNPSPTTYRILTKTLVETGKIDRALELKDEMLAKGLAEDPVVYNHLMSGYVKMGDSDKALEVFEELKGKLGFVSDGIVYGSLMKGYFGKGMEKEALECFEAVMSGDSRVRMGAVGYNLVLDALSKNDKFDEAIRLLERMMEWHNPPRRVTVNLGSFNVMVDGFCSRGMCREAIDVFGQMGTMKCSPDTLSYNNLIEQLCSHGLVAEAEGLYREMGEPANPDEYTYILLMDACFKEERVDDAAGYFQKMVESGLQPNVVAYNKVIEGLLKAGKIDEAKGFFEQMVEKELKPNVSSYDVMLRGLCDAGKLDDVLKIVGDMLNDDGLVWSAETNSFVTEALRKEGREDELVKLYEEKEKEKKEKEEQEKAEALAKEEKEKKEKEEKEKAEALAKEARAFALTTSAIEAGVKDVNDKSNVETSAVGAGVALGEVVGANKDDVLAEETKAGNDGAVEQATV